VSRWGDYFWSFLPKPLRRKEASVSEICRVLEAIGTLYEDARQAVFRLRRAWIVALAPEEMLKILRDERGLPRLPGESLASFRPRVLAAWDTHRKGGTVPGMAEAMALLGLAAEVREPRTVARYDATHAHNGRIRYGEVVWALFDVAFDPGTVLSGATWERILATIDRWKPAHTMLRHLVLQPALWLEPVAPQDAFGWSYGVEAPTWHPYSWPVPMYDGQHQHDGQVTHHGEADPLSVEVIQ